MNSSYIKKTMGTLSLVTLAFCSQPLVAGHKQTECHLGDTQQSIAAAVKKQDSNLAQEINTCFDEFNSGLLAVARIADPSIKSGPIQADYHAQLADIKFDGILEIFRNYANNLDDIADKLKGKAQTDVKKVADDIRTICSIFEAHITENSKMAARLPIPMTKLQNKLKPYVYLMPEELDQPNKTQAQLLAFWGKIIAALY